MRNVEAREAANPSPPPAPTAHTYDPSAPSWAFLAQRAGEGDMLQRIGADPAGLGSIRRYQATARGMDAFGHNYAAGARQRDAAKAEAVPIATPQPRSGEEHLVAGADTTQPALLQSEPILFTAAMQQRPVDEAQAVSNTEATKPAPIGLPPGSYHAPLVPLMNRILAVREGEDVSALRREISAAFYARGDVTGGNQVNMYLSELVEAGVTDAHRREIAAVLARYAKADLEEMGQLRNTLILGAVGGRRPPRTPRAGDPAPDPGAPRVLTHGEKRAVRRYEKNAQEHEEKLEQYKRDPYSQDNEGRLRNAPNEEIRQKIMRSRIEHLEKE